MWVIELGRVKLFSELHPWKAMSSMCVPLRLEWSNSSKNWSWRKLPLESKGSLLNASHWVWSVQVLQGSAARKSIRPNVSHGVWNCQTFQGTASRKSTRPNLDHRLENFKALQGNAPAKNISFNVSHGVWNCQTVQGTALRKNFRPNVSHRVWNGQVLYKELQRENARCSMWVTDFGMVKLAKEVQQ